MAITFPLSLPAVGGQASATIIMLDVVGVGESPFTFSQEVFEHAGKRWGMRVQISRLKRADGEQWVAWLASLRDRHCFPSPRAPA